jgi:L-fuconolactonase
LENEVPSMIDTHVHIWNFSKANYPWLAGDTSILNRSYLIEELSTARKKVGIGGAVLVQAANNSQDTDWMLENATHIDWIKGVVGWLPLQDPEAVSATLANKYLKHPFFKGVRHLIHDEPDPKWLLQPEVIESLKILASYKIPYDVIGVSTEHLETALKVAEKVPDLKMVFDHLNHPPIKSKQQFGSWGELMHEAAQNKQLYAKISGLGTVATNDNSFSENDLKPYINFVIQHFGVDRCFCGGDWPVSLLAGSYTRTWNAYQNIISELLGIDEQKKIFTINASNFYHLSASV